MANWALIIGINHYPARDACLKGAVRDALKMRDWLRDRAAVPKANQLLLLGQCPEESRLPEAQADPVTQRLTETFVKRLMDKSGGEGERLFFYFSGHGLSGRENFSDEDAIILSDFADEYTEGSSLGLSSILQYFRATSFLDQFFFIDACRNIPFEGEFRIGHVRPQTRDPGQPPVQQFRCSATSPGVRAREIGEAGAERGAFTEVLLDGLSGKGSAKQWDQNEEKYVVRWEELFCYVGRTMKYRKISVSGRAAQQLFQVPQQDAIKGTGGDTNPVLAEFSDGSFGNEELRVHVDPAATAKATMIEASDLGEVKERRPANSVPMTFSLPPRPYVVSARAPDYRPEKRRWRVELYAPCDLTVRLLRDTAGSSGSGRVRHNLIPRDYKKLVGRKRELSCITQALDRASPKRLITLTGEPGVGRTALAREAARQVAGKSENDPDDPCAFQAVIWASRRQFMLQSGDPTGRPYPVLSLDDVFVTIASTLKLPKLLQARPEERVAVLRDVLNETRCLLVLDHFDELKSQERENFLSLLTGGARRGPTKAILTGHQIPGLHGLDDIVEALHLRGLAESDAVKLLRKEGADVEQLKRAPHADLVKLARQAHRLPLILRWAVGLLDGSGQPLGLVIEQLQAASEPLAQFCYDALVGLLTAPQKRLLQSVALFPQSTSLEAAASVAQLSRPAAGVALEQLRRMRLAQVDDRRIYLGVRVRRHALADPALDGVLRRKMTSSAISDAQQRVHAARQKPDQAGREYLGRELGNILWAAGQAVEHRRYRAVLDFRDNLHEYMFEQHYFNEGLILGEWAYKSAERLGDLEQQAWCALYPLGRLHFHQGNYEKAQDWCTIGLRAFERLGNQHGIASAQRYLGRIMQARGQMDEAEQLFMSGLQTAEQISSKPTDLKGYLIASVAGLSQARKDYPTAKQGFEQALFQFSETNNWQGISATQRSLGEIALATQSYDEAERRFNDGLAASENHDWPAGRAKILSGQAFLAEAKRQFRRAEGLLGLAHDCFYELSDFPGLCWTDARLARVIAAITEDSGPVAG
jgi:tetratricopeptide (TPR) repeat protein